MKTTKGGKVMNPTDAYRKELRKRELKRNKKERKKVREVGILKKDPESLKEQILKLEAMKAEGALDKARKHKKRQLEDTLNLVLKKRKEYEDKMKEKGETPVMFSHLGPPRRLPTAEEDERVQHPKPEDSVYYHPTLNPTGAPPPGKPPMFKSSIGPRVPLSGASSSGAASSSRSESEDVTFSVLPPAPPPPPPPPRNADSEDAPLVPASLPLPPPPPMPSRPGMTELGASLPPPPLPPPPPGPPPREHVVIRPPLAPPPPVNKSAQPPPPGIGSKEGDKTQSAKLDDQVPRSSTQAPTVLPPPPPPPGLPKKLADNLVEGTSSESDAIIDSDAKDDLKSVLPPPPPPPRQQMALPGPPVIPILQPDAVPPGVPRFTLAPPSMPEAGIPGQPGPPGLMVPLIPRPPFGPPPMMRPPLPPGPPPIPQEDYAARQPAPQKPSYVKSAASTVVKRPLAQHTPELTAMVPASVRVKRELVVPKGKPKAPAVASTTQSAVAGVVKPESTSSSSLPKPQSIDDSYTAFLEDMKALGALDS